MSYSGKCSFQFPIERGDQEIILTVKGQSYFQEGKKYGPIENSYPDEGETEILSILDKDGNSWEEDLSKKELEEITRQIEEEVSSDDEEDPDDYFYD